MTNIPLKNIVFDLVKENGSLTNDELAKKLSKKGNIVPEDKFNKILLDLEILGVIKVSWLTKDVKRIEVIKEEKEKDQIELQNKEMLEKEYEASFPGFKNGQ